MRSSRADGIVRAGHEVRRLPRPGRSQRRRKHRKNLRLSLETSLRRLRTDYIDLYYVHIWDRLTPIAETMRALDDAVRGGKVLHVGLWVGLSTRVVSAFERQARRQAALGVPSDLVFSQPNGAPLRPQSVLHHFHRLCAAAGVP